MQEHTPGPWYFQGYWPDSEWAIGPAIGTDEYNKIDIDPVLSKAQGEDVEFRGNEADARLITAAPNLLAACEEALNFARESDEDLGCNCWPALEEAIRKARNQD